MPPKSLVRTLVQPLAIAVALALAARAVVRIYTIPSRSMVPTLEAGDHIVVTPYLNGGPERGHVVVFRSPLNPDELLIKRVIATPGELLDSRAGRVRIGGHTLAEPYLLRPAATGAIDAQVIAASHYFVAGDNRDDSVDSRQWGSIARERIVGRARLVLWSSGGGASSATLASSSAGNDRRVFKLIR